MVTDPLSGEVTQLLSRWTTGDRAALERLTPIIYEELRRLAGSYIRRERDSHTLSPTELVHEAYLRLIDQSIPIIQSRRHFFGIAAQLMRQVLVDHARQHASAKRGGGANVVSIEDAVVFTPERAADLIALDDALRSLASFDERKSRALELRYFGGLTTEEIAEALGISVATVGRELRLAQAWLHRTLACDQAPAGE